MSEPINNIIDLLRSTADDLAIQQKALLMPIQNYCDIPGAFKKLHQAIGPQTYVTIRPEFSLFRATDKVTVSWTIYCGSTSKNYSAPTLAQAVNACLADQATRTHEEVLADARAVEDALADPLPM